MFREAILVGVLSLAFFFIFHFYTTLGFNYHYKKHHPGACRKINGISFGSEDLEVTTDGLAFITSGLDMHSAPPAFREFMKANKPMGEIFLFDFNKPNLGARTLDIQPSKDFDQQYFHPHGLSLIEDKKKGQHLIYVINHHGDGQDRVEKFRYSPQDQKLHHIRSMADPAMYNLNDLAVLDEDRFYATNFVHFNSSLTIMIENLLPIYLCDIFYFDGNKASSVVTGLRGPNGATFSADKRLLYVTLALDGGLNVYERQENNSLNLVQEVTGMYSTVDNLQLSHNNDALLVGAHPIPYITFQQFANPGGAMPSSVLRFPLTSGRVVTEDITEVFYDHGDLISGSSVAQVYKNKMIIGSVFHDLVLCDLNIKQ